MVEKKSKIFLWVLAIAILLSILVAYYRYVVLGDFAYITDEEIFNEELLYW